MFRGKVGFQVGLHLLLLFTNPPIPYSSFLSPSLRQVLLHKLFFLFVLSKPTPLHKFFTSGEQLSNLVVSRKRKAWEGLHAGGSKGGPGRREEEQQEEGEEEKEEEEGGGSGGEEGGGGSRAWEDEDQEHNQAHFTHPRPSHHHLLSPLNTNFVHEEV